MASPRPPTADAGGWPTCGMVALPPSLTATSIVLPSTDHVTWSRSPGRGYACKMALLSSSLTTTAASRTA
jgi:hypothetical protein